MDAQSEPRPSFPEAHEHTLYTWNEVSRMIGDTVVDRENQRIGKVQDVAQTADSMEPSWLVVKTSMFGRRRLVPFSTAEVRGDVVHVPYGKDQVLEAPVPAVPVTVAASEEERLTHHYAQAA